jgi:hypothetical protein
MVSLKRLGLQALPIESPHYTPRLILRKNPYLIHKLSTSWRLLLIADYGIRRLILLANHGHWVTQNSFNLLVEIQ